MPAHAIIDTNFLSPSVTIQFTDGNNNPVSEPAGAHIEFVSSNPDILSITPDVNNPLKGNVTLPTTVTSFTTPINVTINITGVNDIGNTPYKPIEVSIQIMPPIPAKPASLIMTLVAPS